MRCAFAQPRGAFARAVVLLALGFSNATYATTVEPLMVSTAADFAGQVIIGTVASVHSYWADDPQRIESEIHWVGVEYLKGAPATADGTFRLIVQGGTIGSRQMRIAGAPEFATGERWLLFLLPAYKTHPVVGVHQYALRIVDVGGASRVLSAEGEAVLGVNAEGHIALSANGASHAQSAPTVVGPPLSLERGWGTQTVAAAEGLSEPRHSRADEIERAAPLTEFLATLRPILAASRRYDLVESAGRPEIRPFTSQPLHSASRSGQPSYNVAPRHTLPLREDVRRARRGGDKE